MDFHSQVSLGYIDLYNTGADDYKIEVLVMRSDIVD